MIVDKYRPKSAKDLVGQEQAVQRVSYWARQWEDGIPQKPLLLYGRPGCGKTSLAHAVARDMGWELLEMNASDTRNKSAIDEILSHASAQTTLMGGRRLIVIDEIDGLAGREDRGGVSAVTSIISESKQPVILIANQVYIKKLKALLPETELLEMKPVHSKTLKSYLRKIAEAEKIEVSDEKLDLIVERAGGDVRSAITDLSSPLFYRDRDKDIFSSIAHMFKSDDYLSARSALWDVDLDPEMKMLWVEENIPNEYSDPSEINSAFESLSRADVFNGRISNRQHWGFLKYAMEISTAGAAAAKRRPSGRFVKYRFPSYLQKMSYTVASRAILKSALKKIGAVIHMSSQEVKSQLRFIAPYALKNPEMYKLSETEIKGIQAAVGSASPKPAFSRPSYPKRKSE